MIRSLRRRRAAWERERAEAVWANVPADLDAALPDDLAQEMRADWAREDLRRRWAALRMLWGRPIRHRPRNSRKGWTVYDGHVRSRSENWTVWRAIRATIGIVLWLDWADRHDARWKRRHGRSAVWADNWDMGHWDSRSDGSGWSASTLRLRPWCHVHIEDEGESFV